MDQTPQKPDNKCLNESLTPVRFLSSPRIKSPEHDANFAVCKTRLEALIKQLLDNYEKWLLAQKRGLALCTSIEAIKTRCLEAFYKDNTESVSLYPKELQAYSDKLALISSVFLDITNNTREILRQLVALNRLPRSNNECFYRSWQLPQFVAFATELLSNYEHELVVKQSVMEQISHCMNRCDLIACTSAWEYPQYVDDFVALQLRLLQQEIKIS